MLDAPIKRSAGAPPSALPGMIGFGFLAIFAPAMYVMMVPAIIFSSHFSVVWLNSLLGAAVVWILLAVGAVLGPARYGKIWAIRVMRVMSYAAMAAYICALAWDFVLYFQVKPPDNQMCLWALLGFFFPLGICFWLLARALRREPWFDPAATPAQIGPSLGAPQEALRAAGLDESGRMPAEQRARTLAMGAPPRRWLCYVVPPYVAARLHRWGWFALMLPLCLVALVFAIIVPVRALVVYGFMGALADRFRALQLLRLDAARALPDEPPAHKPRRTRPAKG